MPFQTQPVKNFLGNGLVFPIQLTNGKPILVTGFPLVEASIKTILSFTIGNRFMLGEFGSLLEELIEEPNDEILENLINTYVIDAVTRWEQRVRQISATIDNKNDRGIINLSITYQVVNSSSSQNFIYPFYTSIIY